MPTPSTYIRGSLPFLGVIQVALIVVLILDAILVDKLVNLSNSIYDEPTHLVNLSHSIYDEPMHRNHGLLKAMRLCCAISITFIISQGLKLFLLAFGSYLKKTGLIVASRTLDGVNVFLMINIFILFYVAVNKTPEIADNQLKSMVDLTDIQQKFIHSFGILLSILSFLVTSILKSEINTQQLHTLVNIN